MQPWLTLHWTPRDTQSPPSSVKVSPMLLLICCGFGGTELELELFVTCPLILLANKLVKLATKSVDGFELEKKFRGNWSLLVNLESNDKDRFGLAPVSSRVELGVRKATLLVCWSWWRGVEVNDGLPVTTPFSSTLFSWVKTSSSSLT